MSNSSHYLSPIALPEKDKLRGYENYASWKILMEAHGMPKGFHKYWRNKVTVPAGCTDMFADSDVEDADADGDDDLEVTPKTTTTTTSTPTLPTTVPQPTSTALNSSTPNELEYDLRESAARSSIIINITDLFGTGVNPTSKSHVMWALLKAQYGRVSERARNMRENRLTNCTFKDGGKVAGENGHIEEMQALRRSANEAGAKINDSRFITKLLDSFPKSWDSVVSPMYEEKDLNKVIMSLTGHAERITIRETREGKARTDGADSVRALTAMETSSTTIEALEARIIALQAEVRSSRSSPNSTNRGGSSGGSTNPDKQHLRCINPLCGKVGHLILDCFETGGGKAGIYPPWWRGKRTAKPVAANTASIVEIPGGHYALSAHIDANEIQKLIEENSPIEQRVQAAFAASEDASIISNACVADSGCTSYFFKKREAFVTYNKIQTLVGQSSKAGTSFPVLGFGNVEITIVNNNKRHTLLLKDALHAPDVTANLISISKMDIAGWDIVFGGKKVRFFKEKTEIFSGSLKGGLYLINGSLVINQPTAFTALSLRSPADLATWHRRFAHFGVTRINNAAKLVEGLEIIEGESHGQCEDCIIGNQKRRPYDEKIKPITEVLRLTNIDIWGPARVASTGGAVYGMKFHEGRSNVPSIEG